MNKLLIILLFIPIYSIAQEDGWKSLGRAEKVWVVCHPFSAKKAQRLSKHTLVVMDSMKTDLFFKISGSGSRLDALRHAYWMSLLSNRIGPKRALWLGKAHEKKNVQDFKDGLLEEGSIPDAKAIEMDLRNNEFGVKVGKYCHKCSNFKLLQTVLDALKEGELLMLKQNSKGVFLDKNNKPIPKEEWQGNWENRRLLVPSNL